MRISDFAITSLRAAESANKANLEMAQAQKRISTGLRVNSAADDPGSLGVISRLTGEIQQFVQNSAANLFSQKMLETADLAHKNVQTLLNSMLDSANLSTSSTATTTSRASNQTVVTGLLNEIDGIGLTSSFNGQNLTDGSFVNKSLNGSNSATSIKISIDALRTTELGTNTSILAAKAASDAASATTNGAFNLAGNTTSAIDYAAGASAETIAGFVNAATDQTGVKATAETRAKLKTLSDSGTISFTLNGSASGNITISDSSDLSAITTAINNISSTTGVHAETSADKTSVSLLSSQGKNIIFTAFNNDNSGTDTIQLAAVDRDDNEVNTQTISNTDGGVSAKAAVRGYVVMNSQNAFSYSMTEGAGSDFSSASSSFSSLSTIDISSESGAKQAKEIISGASQSLSDARVELGGVMNRLKFAEDFNQGQKLSLTSARGNIIDADIALESAKLARSSIILETSMAMIAQANIRKELFVNLINSSFGTRFS